MLLFELSADVLKQAEIELEVPPQFTNLVSILHPGGWFAPAPEDKCGEVFDMDMDQPRSLNRSLHALFIVRLDKRRRISHGDVRCTDDPEEADTYQVCLER